MRRVLLIVFCVLSGADLTAQSQLPEKALITYEDGSYFIGNILRRDGPVWNFELSTGDTINLKTEKILDYLSASEVFFYKHRRYHPKKSIFIGTSLATHAGWESSVHWDGTIGMSVTEKVDFGVGVAISGHDLDLGDDWVYNEFVNLYGYGRYCLNDRSMRLYLDAKAGYASPINWWDESNTGGMYFQPGVGVLLSSRGYFKWHVGLSQYLLHTKGQTTSWGPGGNTIEVDYDIWYNRTVFQFGVTMMLLPRELRNFSFF